MRTQALRRLRTTVPTTVAFCCVLTFAAALPAADPPEKEIALEDVLSLFLEAWTANDAEAVNAFVLDKGAEIALAPRGRMLQSVKPARGRYLFQSLFRDTAESGCEILKLSPVGDDGVAHAVFAWTYRSGGHDREERVFSSWTLWEGRWRMSELRLGR